MLLISVFCFDLQNTCLISHDLSHGFINHIGSLISLCLQHLLCSIWPFEDSS